MRIIFAGTPANAAKTLEALLASPYEVVAVLTRLDAPVGRKRIPTPSPVAEVASRHNIRVIKMNAISAEAETAIAELKVDLGVVVAYGAFLKKSALDIPKNGWVNLHYSLLPKWRGAAPVQHSILNGDAITGVTLFELDEGMDTGKIYGSVETELQPRENASELLHRLTELGITLLNQELPRIASGLVSPKPQTGESSLAPKIHRKDAQIDWNQDALRIERQVRAMNPEPVAYATVGEDSIRILDAVALGKTDWSALEPEQLVVGSISTRTNRVLVQTGAGTLLELKQVQPAGKKVMSALDWMRGSKVTNFDVVSVQIGSSK